MAKQKYKWGAIGALGLLASVAIAPRAIAQDDMFMNFFMDAGNVAASYIGNVAVGEAMIDAYGGGDTSEPSYSEGDFSSEDYGGDYSEPAGQSMGDGDFSFQPSSEVSDQIRAQFIAQYASDGTPGSLPFRQLIETQNWVGEFSSDFYGLSSTDVADAMTAYWVRSWMLINDQPSPTMAQIDATNRQIRALLADDPTFTQSPDAQLQVMAEYLIYQQSITYGTYLAAVSAGDTDSKEQIQAAVNTGLSELGLDFTQLEITDEGFQVR
jgi:hypothetical protein